ncbi:unnamed protein product [Musa acuminata subsp. malaccensis]|uniref:(wild Malaysian banana) hypothetical protein n=1 Tax=Musa acuminata subsp. malaccensis TaxID=214687 RepID=A0A804J4N5_MUSAM|nr:unnamed protein product [Musa acuminata subsp. malaccensis]
MKFIEVYKSMQWRSIMRLVLLSGATCVEERKPNPLWQR